MAAVPLVEKKLEGLLKYSTPIGHVNHAVLFFGRFCTMNLLHYMNIDDLREFKCDTLQPGCAQICNNHFMPMSHARFFNLQIMIMVFPRLIFHTISQWEEGRVKEAFAQSKKEYIEKKKKYDTDVKEFEKSNRAIKEKPIEPVKPSDLKMKKYTQLNGPGCPPPKANTKQETVWTPKIARLYVAHLLILLFLEILALWLLNLLQQAQYNLHKVFVFSAFIVPEEYKCISGTTVGNSCKLDNDEIPCFVPRSYDKTIYMWYHIFMSMASILLLTADITYTTQRHMRKRYKRRKQRAMQRSV